MLDWWQSDLSGNRGKLKCPPVGLADYGVIQISVEYLVSKLLKTKVQIALYNQSYIQTYKYADHIYTPHHKTDLLYIYDIWEQKMMFKPSYSKLQ